LKEHRFIAMGCEVVVGGASSARCGEIERLFADRERVFSRFVPESELNRLNARSGAAVLVTPIFARALKAALDAEAQTGGVVTPTLGAQLEAAGYTRDRQELAPVAEPPNEPGTAGGVTALGRIVRLDPGVKLDLNGVVKAMAVDDALSLIQGSGFVSAGGDVAARGELSVSLPADGIVSLRRGALATSGTTKRRWLRANQVQHHLIDVRTGRPSTSPWSEVTACGASCFAADTAAKAGFLMGEAGPGWLDERAIPARFVDRSGAVHENEIWRTSMLEPACI
jgi:FAD:protein FMN transferase